MYKITQKNNKNHVLKGVYQHLFCWVSDGKSCFSARKSILTSKWHTENLFAGQNIQQSYQNEVKKLKKKNSKKAYFEQQTQCTALIYWSKYTATGFKLFQNQIETNIVP